MGGTHPRHCFEPYRGTGFNLRYAIGLTCQMYWVQPGTPNGLPPAMEKCFGIKSNVDGLNSFSGTFSIFVLTIFTDCMELKFDFLVVGSGLGGLSFALKAAEHGSVCLITKSGLEETNTRYCLLYTSPSPRDVEESRR